MLTQGCWLSGRTARRAMPSKRRLEGLARKTYLALSSMRPRSSIGSTPTTARSMESIESAKASCRTVGENDKRYGFPFDPVESCVDFDAKRLLAACYIVSKAFAPG